jgi:hypothetical protein
MASVKNRGYVTVSKIRTAEAKSMRNERGQDQHGRPQFKSIADQAAELAVYAATHTTEEGRRRAGNARMPPPSGGVRGR